MSKSPQVSGLSTESRPTRVPLGWLSLFLASMLITLLYVTKTAMLVYHTMLHLGWERAIHNNIFWLGCLNDAKCSATFQNGFTRNYPLWTLIIPLAGVVALIYGSRPKTYLTKDPGLSWWAQADDRGMNQYRTHDTRRKENRLLGYLGHHLSIRRDGSIDYSKTVPLYVRMAALAENFLIIGGVGAGKTRGYFRPLIMLGAMLGFTVIVFDLKYPQADSGFYDMIGFWEKCKRPVMMFTPFSPNTNRLPLMDDVADYPSALSTATTIMPPPEYGLEPGKFYRDRDRGVLAAFLLAVAKSDTPNFQELLRMAQYTPNELKAWFERQVMLDPESEVVLNLKGLFAQGNQEVASVLLGIKNALRIFYNPMLARATQSQIGENIDLGRAFRTPTLIYVGIQQEYMMEGDGVVLLQLTKRYIDRQLQREAERQGGSLKVHTAYALDEFPSFGLLPYMMRSLGVLRSYNVSHHLGIQNLSQIAVVYGDRYSTALTNSVIGRKIFFPRAVDGEDKEMLSKEVGMTTVSELSESDSRSRHSAAPLSSGSSQGVSIKKVARPLLAEEQFRHEREMEAVAIVRGSNPIKLMMPAIEDPYVEGDGVPRRIQNGLHELYLQVNPEKQNMAEYTRKVIAAGKFGVATEQGEDLELSQFRFQSWIGGLLERNARLRFAGAERDRLYLRTSDMDGTLTDAQLAGNHSRGWTGSPSGDELRITQVGLALLEKETRLIINQQATFGTLLDYLERNAVLVEGRPERKLIPETERKDAAALLQGPAVLLRHKVCRDLFGAVPEALNKRIGKSDYIEIDLGDPAAFWDDLQFARSQAAQQDADEARQQEGDARPAKVKASPKKRSRAKNSPASQPTAPKAAQQSALWERDDSEGPLTPFSDDNEAV